MVSVVSPFLVAVGAAWDDGPGAGKWIADRLGPFGPSVGHAVPLGFQAYAIVPIPFDEEAETDLAPIVALENVLDVLGAFTGDQPVHSGMWEGWAWWYDTGTDPRTAPGMGAGVYWPQEG